jgi:hypothetical protein
MGRKKHGNNMAVESTASCQESIKAYKDRYKSAKENLKLGLELIENEGVSYEFHDEFIGYLYLRKEARKRELKYRKNQK